MTNLGMLALRGSSLERFAEELKLERKGVRMHTEEEAPELRFGHERRTFFFNSRRRLSSAISRCRRLRSRRRCSCFRRSISALAWFSSCTRFIRNTCVCVQECQRGATAGESLPSRQSQFRFLSQSMSHQTGGRHPSQYLIDVPQARTLCGIYPGHAPELSSAWIPTAEAAPALFPAGQTQQGGVRVAV